MKQKIHSVIDIFSYWIFIWFMLFYLNIIKYNPFYFLIIGLLINTIQSLLYLYNLNYIKFIYFIIVNILIKVVPLLLIQNKSRTINDIMFGIFLIFVYLCFIFIKRYYEISKSKTLYESILQESKSKKITTPGMYYLKKIFDSIH